MRVAHLALDLGLRRERGDRVDRDDVERARADEQLGDLERLLAGVGLRDEEVVDVDADALRVRRVHRVLGVDEGADAAAALRLGDHVVDERRLAGRLRAEDLDDAAARQPADAEREVERERAGRDRADGDRGAVVHLHDRALAELALDLPERDVECFVLVHLQPPRREPTPERRTAPLRDAVVTGKQRRRTERTFPCARAAARAGGRGGLRKRATVRCGSQRPALPAVDAEPLEPAWTSAASAVAPPPSSSSTSMRDAPRLAVADGRRAADRPGAAAAAARRALDDRVELARRAGGRGRRA